MTFFGPKNVTSVTWGPDLTPLVQTLPKAQRAQGIEYFDSFNIFGSKQKLQQALKSWSNFSLGLSGKGREKQRNIARIANAVQVTICLLVSTSVY